MKYKTNNREKSMKLIVLFWKDQLNNKFPARMMKRIEKSYKLPIARKQKGWH